MKRLIALLIPTRFSPSDHAATRFGFTQYICSERRSPTKALKP
jgi:hypothetical protein